MIEVSSRAVHRSIVDVSSNFKLRPRAVDLVDMLEHSENPARNEVIDVVTKFSRHDGADESKELVGTVDKTTHRRNIPRESFRAPNASHRRM